MDSTNFCYWLKGFFEISGADTLTKEQVQEIKNHLDLVFKKMTPNVYESIPPFKYEPTTLPQYTPIPLDCFKPQPQSVIAKQFCSQTPHPSC